MARYYHVDIARHAANADAKWLDNLLSHFAVPGVIGGTQGVARQITERGIYHIALIRRLTNDLGVPTSNAVSLAAHLLVINAVQVTVAPGLELRLDQPRFQREMDAAVAEAMEAVTPVRRGRPPKTTRPSRGGRDRH